MTTDQQPTEPIDFRAVPPAIAPAATGWQAWWEDHDIWDGFVLYADLDIAKHHAAVDYIGEEYSWVPGDDPADEAPETTLTWAFEHRRWHLLDNGKNTNVQLYETATYAPLTEQATLRDRIAEALAAVDGWAWTPDFDKTLSPVWQGYLKRTDAVLAVLPEPPDRAASDCICGHTEPEHFEDTCLVCDCGDYLVPEAAREVIARWRTAAIQARADRAAVLREALEVARAEAERLETGNQDARAARGARSVAYLLRRLAAETQPAEVEAHPAEHTWAAELYDPLSDEWVPGTRFLVRERAVNALEHGRRTGPAWRDGTPTRRRLVRATTTYTVEPDTEAAVEARQDGV